MRSKIKNKLIASLVLTVFMATNTLGTAIAMGDSYIGYNANRPSIRATGVGESVSLKSGLHLLNGDTRVNLSLREADVTQVLRMFADQAGMNIIFTPEVVALNAAGKEENAGKKSETGDAASGTVTLDLVDIPLEQAFNLVITSSNLYYDIQGNAIIVSTRANAVSLSERSQVTVLPVKYSNAAAVAHFINVNFFGSKDKMKANPGISAKSAVVANPITNEIIVAGTDSDVEVVKRLLEQVDRKPAITTYKVNHTTPAEMASAICTSLIPGAMFIGTDDAGSSSGGAAGVPTGFASDSSSSSDSSSIAVSGGKLACSFAAVNSDDFDDDSGDDDDEDKLISFPSMGMTVTYFPSLGTVQVIGGSQHQLALIGDYIAANDRKTPQAYLEVQIVSLNETGSKTFDNQWQFLSKNFSFNAGSNAGGFATNTMYPVFFAGHGFTLTGGSYDEDTGAYTPTGVIRKWGTSPQLVYAVNYLVSSGKGRILANPKILLTSGKTSKIDLSSEYVDTVTTQYLSTGTIGTSQTQKEITKGSDNGITVEIASFISPDGYVTMDITPQYNSIASRYNDSTTGDLLATLLQKRILELKGIRVKDGETLVIGGMIQESETKDVTKIPFLGDIPVLGMFFRSTVTQKDREEMVMMLTPQIVVDTEDAVGAETL